MTTLDSLRERNRTIWQRDVNTPGYQAAVVAADAEYIPALEARVAELETALRDAAQELGADHRPQWASDHAQAIGKRPIGCVVCYPGDGSWPCVPKIIADDLARVLDGTEGAS